jgi:hypothetical protein
MHSDVTSHCWPFEDCDACLSADACLVWSLVRRLWEQSFFYAAGMVSQDPEGRGYGTMRNSARSVHVSPGL